MYILGIATSPRESSNSELLLDALLDALPAGDAAKEKLVTRVLRVFPCRACGACAKLGHCVQRDDVEAIYAKLLEADRVILASPIFFLSVAAQTKMLIDRAQFAWAKKHIRKERLVAREFPAGRMGYFIAVGGTRGKHLFDHAVPVVKCFLETLDVQYGGGIFCRGIDAAGEVLQHPEILEQARTAARSVLAGKRLLDPQEERPI